MAGEDRAMIPRPWPILVEGPASGPRRPSAGWVYRGFGSNFDDVKTGKARELDREAITAVGTLHAHGIPRDRGEVVQQVWVQGATLARCDEDFLQYLPQVGGDPG